MHEAVVALQGIQAAGAAGPQSPAGSPAPAGPAGLGAMPPEMVPEQPSAAEAAAFAQAAGLPGPQAGVAESWAARPAVGGSLGHRLAQQAESLAAHLRAPGAGLGDMGGMGNLGAGGEGAMPGFGAPGTMPAGPHDLSQTLAANKAEISQSLDRMERAYMFAIETTMASRGSTEATKIFNTLLKGQ